MATIIAVKARQIFDSNGNPTVEVDVTLDDGTLARAAVPSGALTGTYEALELRDGGSDYLGKGVLKAVDNVNSIIGPALIGKDPTEQTQIDNFMVQQLDGTVNERGWCKQKLGTIAIFPVSLAVCRAGAMVKKIPLYKHIANLAENKNLVLPVPAFNVINGGSHAGNKLAMQEFEILPVGATSFKEAMKMGVEVYHQLNAVIKEKYGQDATNVDDEGVFAPNIQENKEGLELLKTAIERHIYVACFAVLNSVLKSIMQHIANLARNKNLVLPVPAFNVINGGSHAGNELAMQEFMILTVGASCFKEAMKMGVEVYHHLKAVIKKKYGQDATNVGDEGVFAPNIQENKEGLELLKTAIARHIYGACFMVLNSGLMSIMQPIANLAGNKNLVLLVPAFNVINGASDAGNKLAMQEFMILPVGASCFKEAMKMGIKIYHHLKAVIKKKYGQDATNVGDEGGFAPNIQENKDGLELLKTAIAKAGYTGKVVIGMDVAASEFYDLKDKNNDGSQKISGDSLKNLYKSFVADYPIVSIEDPFDDLLVTNPKRVGKAIKEKSCNALLLKVNEIGSVTESIEAVKMAKHAGWGVMASHQSVETKDTFIADLSVGLATGQIKTGAPCRERLAKYNQFLRIEEELGSAAIYAGAKYHAPVQPY